MPISAGALLGGEKGLLLRVRLALPKSYFDVSVIISMQGGLEVLISYSISHWVYTSTSSRSRTNLPNA
jgi:hypothetical protein